MTQNADIPLSDLPLQQNAAISRMLNPTDARDQHLVLRLIEIGFLPGTLIRIVAHGHPGHEPLAVRLGHTTFALRRHEASFIRVIPT